MYSNGFLNMMIYMHTINTSLESNNENDDDAIELITYYVIFNLLFSETNILHYLITNQF
jgi:hypothetical protein